MAFANRRPYRRFQLISISTAALLSTNALAQLDSTPQSILPDLRYSTPIDLDDDGRDEVVGVSHVSNELVAYSLENDGSVSFTRTLAEVGAQSTFTIHRWDLQLADINGDGFGDLLGPDLDVLRVFYGRADSTLEESVEIQPITFREDVVPMDLDADGDLDLVLYPPATNVGASGPRPIQWTENLGDGTLVARGPLITGADDYQLLDPIDVDGDGDIDLVGFRGLNRVPVIVRNLGTTLQAEALPGGLERAFASQPGDVDGDGDVDLLVLRANPTSAFSEEIDLYRNDAGVFQAPTVVLVEPDGFRFDLALANIDGTGPNELIGIVTEAGVRVSIRVYPWTSQGVYGPAADEIDVAEENSFRATLTIGSFDGDDRDDLFLRWLELTNPSFDERFSPRIFRGSQASGAPAFTEPTLLTERVSNPFFAADLDGDRVLDLIQSAGSQLLWRRGIPGSARFRSPETIPVAGSVEFVEDLDGDGLPEVVLTREEAGGTVELVVLGNLGGGVLGAPSVIAAGLPVQPGASGFTPTFEAQDFDSDGDLDIIPSRFSQDLSWFENRGTLDFAPPAAIAITPSLPFNILQAADLNGDDILDYLELDFVVFGDSTLSWFEGLGGGAFAPSQAVLTSPDSSPKLADVNEDGILDIVYVDSNSTFVIVGGPAGPGTGAAGGAPVLLINGAGVSGAGDLQLVDIDNDGSTDLVQASRDLVTVADPLAFPRLGPLSFASTPITIAPQPIRLLDFGGDGDLDGFSHVDLFDVVFENLSLGESGMGYCGPAVVNSSGSPASLSALGTSQVQNNELSLRVDDAPAGTFGFFLASLVSQPAASVPGSAGRLCLGGQIGRYVGPGQIQSASATGTFQLALDLNGIPTPNGPTAALPGATWFFQAWFRDTAPSGPTSNFTNGVEVNFL
jgi:hypothetical protein